MEQSPSVPHESALINAAATTPIQRTFGSTWRERIGVVGGFRVQTGAVDGGKAIIFDVANLGSVAVENTHRLEAGGHIHYFLQLPNEHVVQVDVYATAEKQTTTSFKAVTKTKSDRINALRFRTNERTSEWFGSCKGTAAQFTPPEGHCIQALYGSVNTDGYCGQVGVCYAPAGDSSSSGSAGETDGLKLTEIACGPKTFEISFRVQSDQPRAFVVTGENFIQDVAVVSKDQYQSFNELDPSHDYVDDHWLVLLKDERVEAVGVGVRDGRLVALRFRTNYRTSVWFGSPATSDELWLDSAGSPGAFICGFLLEGMGTTACTQVTSIAAIYKSQAVDDKEEKAAVDLASKAA